MMAIIVAVEDGINMDIKCYLGKHTWGKWCIKTEYIGTLYKFPVSFEKQCSNCHKKETGTYIDMDYLDIILENEGARKNAVCYQG